MLLFYFVFALGIVGMLGLLQFLLIKPYYRENKIDTVRQVSQDIRQYLIDGIPDSETAAKALQVTVDNNVCVVIFNDAGKTVYDADSLGSGCVFHANRKDIATSPVNLDSGTAMRDYLIAEGGEVSLNLVNTRTNQDMVVYGQIVRATLGNYYLFVNSPLEPVDSIVRFFSRQYLTYTVVILFLSMIVSWLLSDGLTRPILSMRREADKLAHADYSAEFDGGSYTETKELAATLNGARDQLSKIDELRKDLIANVSHDIKTPLTSIRAYAEMVKDISGDDPKKREEHLDVIIDEVGFLDRLVVDMSELSRMKSGNYVLHQSNFDISEIIHDVVRRYEPLLEESGLIIQEEVPEGIIVYADEVKIAQVINNYLSNAIKHTPAGRNIYVRLVPKDDYTVRVEVEDEGEGIAESELPYIWDRYQNSSRSFSRSMTSTGLGLAIVKAILDTHKAKYGVSSTLGSGSLFWFELSQPEVEETDEPD